LALTCCIELSLFSFQRSKLISVKNKTFYYIYYSDFVKLELNIESLRIILNAADVAAKEKRNYTRQVALSTKK